MVVGLERFRDHLQGLETSYALIGGAACDAWMARNGLPFRATKDLDIVLVIEALQPEFVARFKAFVRGGRYQVRTRQETGTREFFRFMKPEELEYPFMLELFARAPVGLDLGPGQEIAPVAVEESVVSLSAILLEQEFYDLVLATRYDADGIPMVSADGLIPLKARAYLDLVERRAEGAQVDLADIKKHRNDIFRLALTLPSVPGPERPQRIVEVVRSFLYAFPEQSPEWPSIQQALAGTVRIPPAAADLLRTVSTYFRVEPT
jgi:hypothetical protein